MFKEEVNKQFAKLEKNNTHGPLCLGYVLFMFSSYVSLINFFLFFLIYYVCRYGRGGRRGRRGRRKTQTYAI